MDLIPIPSGLETGFFAMSRGALADLPELLKLAFPGKTPWLIADENTFAAAGKQAQERLQAAGSSIRPPKIFPRTPKLHPDYRISQELAANITPDCVPVVVGSGVLNDLTKCAAGIAKVKYCCVATAASVDGYTSYGGAMSVDGMKKTVPCPAPYALLADIDVLETAPAEMLASGYADLLTKVPAGADWCISDALGLEPIAPEVWDMVQKDLRLWVSDPGDLNHVFMGLAATGYAMQRYRDSRPASGAEHMFSHVWEMEHLQYRGEEPSHGFKVGIGTIAVIQLMEFVIATPEKEARKLARPLPSRREREARIADLLAAGCYGDSIPAVALAKFQEGDAARERQELIFSKWEELQTHLKKQLLPLPEVLRLLKLAGAPTEYAEIGLSRKQYLHGLFTAQLIRKRYTVLDMLFETGLLDVAAERLR